MKYFLPVLVGIISFAGVASAQSFNLMVCGVDTNGDGVVTSRNPNEQCTFADIMELAQNVITALILLSSFLAVIAFIYAGFLLMTSGGNETQKTRSKDIFKKVFIGYLWILSAWIIVYTITSLLQNQGFNLLTR